MSRATGNATKSNRTLQNSTLTVAQENAVDALVAGMRDAEVATLVGVNRVTVTKWRLYQPHFQAAINERRQAIWSASVERLRSLVPLALTALSDELKVGSRNRLQAALGVLKLVPVPVPSPSGPTTADGIVWGIAAGRVPTPYRSPLDEAFMRNPEPTTSTPEDYIPAVWADLETQFASEINGSAMDRSGEQPE